VATTVFHAPVLAVPSVVYALLMNVGAFGLIAVGRRWVGASPPATADRASVLTSSV
jgi:hypothetical protein